MSGQTAFEQLIKNIEQLAPTVIRRISQIEYDNWQRELPFDILRGLRTGQSFCNHFGIIDNILYYEFSWINAEDYIKRTYLEQS